MSLAILPSVLCRTKDEMEDRFEKCQGLVDEVHVDLADGLFVDNRLPGPDELAVVPTTLAFEAHLMVEEPELWVDQLLQDSRVSRVVLHAESKGNLNKLIPLVKASGRKAGLALNPSTPISALQDLASLIDQVTIMTVEPGFNGSPFLPAMIAKIASVHHKYPDLTLEADGGVSDKTLPDLMMAGVDRVTVGHYFSQDMADRLDALRKISESVRS